MFNINKTPESTTTEIKENVTELIENAERNLGDLAQDAKKSASDIGNKALEKGNETKNEAYQVIQSLKALLAQYSDSSQISEIKEQVTSKAAELKGRATEFKHTVEDEVSHAYETGKARTVQTVQEQPLLSLVLVLGAGALIGYILGSKQNNK